MKITLSIEVGYNEVITYKGLDINMAQTILKDVEQNYDEEQ